MFVRLLASLARVAPHAVLARLDASAGLPQDGAMRPAELCANAVFWVTLVAAPWWLVARHDWSLLPALLLGFLVSMAAALLVSAVFSRR